jgi:hypothetical protein
LTRWDEERKQIEGQIQTRPKLEELITYKDLIKLLTSLIDLFKDLIEEKLSLKINLAKVGRLN